MIRAIQINNIRGIRHGRLEGFTPLVILVGPNSAGKSTVLDSLLLGASSDTQSAYQQIISRRQELNNNGEWLFFQQGGSSEVSADIQIQSDDTRLRHTNFRHMGGSNLSISSEFTGGDGETPPTHSPSLFGSPSVPPLSDVAEIRLVEPNNQGRREGTLADLYSWVARRGLRKEAKSIVTDLVPDLEDIEIQTENNNPTVHLVYKNGSLPLAVAGDGVRLLVRLSLELAAPLGGVVLLEEPEVHMHPAALRQCARAIHAAISRGIQIILTTHSLDLIDYLLAEANPSALDLISLYRLQLRDNQLVNYRLSGTEISLARNQVEDDLR